MSLELPAPPSDGLRTRNSDGFGRGSEPVRTRFGGVCVLTPYTPGRPNARLDGLDAAKRVVAVDIGRAGALALFIAGKLAEIADMPVLADGPACRPTVNGPLLATLFRRWAPTEAVVEHVSARPGEAPSGAFAFGRSRGVIEGVLGAQEIQVRFVTPSWWKRRVGIPAGADMKDRARSVAISRWPQLAEHFARVKDHDRAEACLIGLAYMEERRR